MTSNIDSVRDELNSRLAAAHAAIDSMGLPVGAVAAFVRSARLLGPYTDYKHFSVECRDQLAVIGQSLGLVGQRRLLDAAMFQAMSDAFSSGKLVGLPPRARQHQLRQFMRILRRDDPLPSWLDLDDDFFQKDFGLAAMRLYAGAAQLIDARCGIGRSLFLKSGLSGLGRGLALAVECGGLKPMFEIHTHRAYLEEFNEEGWNECYRVCADLYGLHPEVKGMVGGSWFYDPAIAQVSPRLAYLSDIPRNGGAHFFLAATEGHFVKDALATSPSRRKLHEEGKYAPRSFMLVWGKKAQINWASNNGLATD